MSWGQYVLLQRGYWKKQNRIWESDWSRTRELFWLYYNSKSRDSYSRHELMPLPSDPAPVKRTREQDQEAFFKALDAFSVN